MEKQYTATIGEHTVAITIKEWPEIAAHARRNELKAYLVWNANNQVIAEA